LDAVYHLGAAGGARRVAEDAAGTWSRNVLGTATLLEGAAGRGVPVLVVSTSEVYGTGRGGLLREDEALWMDPSGRRDVYAVSKAAGEAYALSLARERGLPATVARLFNVVGRRQSPRYGMVLPRFCAAVRAGVPLEVHGDGTQRRCFLHVEDAVDALVALQREPRARGLVVNVGSDEEVSIRELADLVIEEAGGRGETRFVPLESVYGPGFADFSRRRPDLARLRALVAFRPARTLRDAVRDVLAAVPAA
jgi:UDP-glucose 4-epimerase